MCMMGSQPQRHPSQAQDGRLTMMNVGKAQQPIQHGDRVSSLIVPVFLSLCSPLMISIQIVYPLLTIGGDSRTLGPEERAHDIRVAVFMPANRAGQTFPCLACTLGQKLGKVPGALLSFSSIENLNNLQTQKHETARLHLLVASGVSISQ